MNLQTKHWARKESFRQWRDDRKKKADCSVLMVGGVVTPLGVKAGLVTSIEISRFEDDGGPPPQVSLDSVGGANRNQPIYTPIRGSVMPRPVMWKEMTRRTWYRKGLAKCPNCEERQVYQAHSKEIAERIGVWQYCMSCSWQIRPDGTSNVEMFDEDRLVIQVGPRKVVSGSVLKKIGIRRLEQLIAEAEARRDR